jgi:hypothetical protein
MRNHFVHGLHIAAVVTRWRSRMVLTMTVPSPRRRLRDRGMERTLRINGLLPSSPEPPAKERGTMRRLLWFVKEIFWKLPV